MNVVNQKPPSVNEIMTPVINNYASNIKIASYDGINDVKVSAMRTNYVERMKKMDRGGEIYSKSQSAGGGNFYTVNYEKANHKSEFGYQSYSQAYGEGCKPTTEYH
jgi:hypothetical protein